MTIFSVLEGRLNAILFSARGADGSLGADATARSIPLDRFRPAAGNAPLRDLAYPCEQLDRAVRLEWMGIEDAEGDDNELDSVMLRVARLSLQVGYVQGADVAVQSFAKLIGSETAAAVTVAARARALSDAERIRRALALSDLFAYGGLDPVPLSCDREGGAAIEDLNDGRVVCATIYRVLYQADSATNYDP